MNLNRESHTPTTIHVLCNVFESNNIVEQKCFPHAPELQIFSLEIFAIEPNAMLETVNIDVDDKCVLPPKKTTKVVTNINLQISRNLVCENAMDKAHF
jgi:hypothetical protein